jgi:hypothetical protein
MQRVQSNTILNFLVYGVKKKKKKKREQLDT